MDDSGFINYIFSIAQLLSLTKKMNLLNNKGIYDLQYKGCLFTHPLLTQIYYTKEINFYLLHYINPSL